MDKVVAKKEASPVATEHRLPKFIRTILITIVSVVIFIIAVWLIVSIFLHSNSKTTLNMQTITDKKSHLTTKAAALWSQIQENRKRTKALEIATKKIKQQHAACDAGLASCQNKTAVTIKILSHRFDPISPFADKADKGGNNDTVSSGHSIIQSVDAQKVLHPGYIIQAGQVLHAVLSNAIDSTQPGMVIGHLTEDVWASDGSRILLPRYTKITGHYEGRVSQGQARLYVIWDRASTPKPNPLSIDLESSSYDALGRAGQKADSIDAHFFQRFGMASLMSIIGASVATQGVASNDTQNSSNAYRQGVASSFQDAASTALAQGLAIQPTIHVYQGARINIMVGKDLNFYQVVPHG